MFNVDLSLTFDVVGFLFTKLDIPSSPILLVIIFHPNAFYTNGIK